LSRQVQPQQAEQHNPNNDLQTIGKPEVRAWQRRLDKERRVELSKSCPEPVIVHCKGRERGTLTSRAN
jgi:hypothetical protein